MWANVFVWTSGWITKVLVCLTTPVEFDAVNTTLLVPVRCGTPVIRPSVAMESPAGRLEALNVIGVPPIAVTELLKATATVPLKELVEVIRKGWVTLSVATSLVTLP